MPKILTYAFASAILLAGLCFASDPDESDRVELGTVKWNRDYAAAKKTAEESGKPLLLFFQEVPG